MGTGRAPAKYDFSGQHQLWLQIGGSVGFSSSWALDIDEGVLADDFTGKKWVVGVQAASEAQASKAEKSEQAKSEAKRRRDRDDETVILGVVDRLDPHRQGVGAERVKAMNVIPKGRAIAALVRLEEEGVLVTCVVQVVIGSGATKPAKGIKRTGVERNRIDELV